MIINVKLVVLAVAALGFFAQPAMAQQNNNKKPVPAPAAPVHAAAAKPAAVTAPVAGIQTHQQTQTSRTNTTSAKTTGKTKQVANSCASQKTPAAVRACNVSKGYPASAGSVVYLPADSAASNSIVADPDTGSGFPQRGAPMTNAQRGWSDDAPKNEGDSANGDTAYGEGHGGGQ